MNATTRRHAALAILILAAALSVTACGSSPPPDMTVNGTVIVPDNPVAGENSPVDTGSQVTVTDPSGKVIGFTTLNGNAPQGATYTLTFGFTVKVPEGESSYTVTVQGLTGSEHYTQAQMKAGLTLCSGTACGGGF